MSSWYGKAIVAHIDILGAKDKAVWCREFCGIIAGFFSKGPRGQNIMMRGWYPICICNVCIHNNLTINQDRCFFTTNYWIAFQPQCSSATVWLQLDQGITTSTCMKQWLILADLCSSGIGYINITITLLYWTNLLVVCLFLQYPGSTLGLLQGSCPWMSLLYMQTDIPSFDPVQYTCDHQVWQFICVGGCYCLWFSMFSGSDNMFTDVSVSSDLCVVHPVWRGRSSCVCCKNTFTESLHLLKKPNMVWNNIDIYIE